MSRKLNLVLLVIFGLVLAALVTRQSGLAWMAVPFLCYVGAGLINTPRETLLRAARKCDQVRCESDTDIHMAVKIENESSASAWLRVIEELPPKIHPPEDDTQQAMALSQGETGEIAYCFQAQRGAYRWEQVRVMASDPFELVERRMVLPAVCEVRVLPGQTPVKRLRTRPLETLQAPGPNLSRRAGSGIDFFGVREYQPGDSLRRVHWGLSARHPGQFFSKEFEREEVADIGLVLDGSAANNLRYGDDELLEYSIQAAAALAKTLLRAGNRLSLLTLGAQVARVFPGTGKHQLVRILDTLAGCQPGENVSLNTLKYLPVRLFPSHALMILFSPLGQGDYPAVARLRASGYQVLLVSPDPVHFAGRGARHPLVSRAARLERQALLWRVRDIGVQVIDWQIDQPLNKVTSRFQWELTR